MPVLVNPNRPLGMGDFAAMYTANGQTPQQNASDLWFNAPSEGRNYMEDQWSRLNTGTSPEQYFSDPAHAAAALSASSPSVRGGPAAIAADPLGRIPVSPIHTGQEQWPMYENEAARTTAINLGADQRGSYTTPDRMMAAVSGTLKGVPESDLLDHPDLRKLLAVNPAKAHYVYSQLTGRGNYSKDIAEREQRKYAEGRELDQRTYTRSQLEDARKYSESKLDDARAWQNDEIMQSHEYSQGQRDEERKYIEQKSQAAAIAAMQRRPIEHALDWAEKEIQNGARINPITGKWQLWQTVEPEPGAIDNRPIRKMVDATPEQQLWLHQHYRNVTGFDLPQNHREDYSPILQHEHEMSPEQTNFMQKRISDYKRDKGYEPNASTRQHFMMEAEQAINPTTSSWYKFGQGMLDFGSAARKNLTPYSGMSPEEAAALNATLP